MRVSLHLPRNYDGLVYLYDASRNPPVMRSHSHREIEVNLVVEGSLVYRIGSRRQKLLPGCMIWLCPGREHQLLDRSHSCKSLVAAFKPEMVRRLGFDPSAIHQLRREGHLVRNIRANDAVFVASVCRHILEGQVDHQRLNAGLGYGQSGEVRYQHANPALLNSGLHFLLTTCWQAFQAGDVFHGIASLHPAVARAIELLQVAGHPLSLPELGRRCGSSPSHLSRLFHRQTGLRLNEYRNMVRLERFLAIYGDGTGRTATEACLEVGFGSYAQFFKVFQKAYRRSPRAYARSLRLDGPSS